MTFLIKDKVLSCAVLKKIEDFRVPLPATFHIGSTEGLFPLSVVQADCHARLALTLLTLLEFLTSALSLFA